MKHWKRPLQIIVGAITTGIVIGLAVQTAMHASAPPSVSTNATPVESFNAASSDQQDPNVLAMERDIQAQERANAEKEKVRARRAAAGAKLVQSRKNILFFKQSQWSALITTNFSIFEASRKSAASAADRWVRCQICDGRGQMNFCLACGNSGTCSACGGTGQMSSDQMCPACFGTGKCFLCTGSGMMACPFCDDGLVTANQPYPPQTLTVQ